MNKNFHISFFFYLHNFMQKKNLSQNQTINNFQRTRRMQINYSISWNFININYIYLFFLIMPSV